MNDTKFAPCECDATDESWGKIDQSDHGDSTDLVYECQTCGGQYWFSAKVVTV